MADALDGSTQNMMNVFSFGATDYVGATQTDTFQGWQWDWQRGLFTFSREMLISAATGGSGTMMRTSTGTARYAWGGVWIAGLGYDSYNMGQHSSQAYEDFRQGDIRGGLWHTGLAVVSAFGLRAGLKGSALGKAGSTVDETSALAKVADEAPNRVLGNLDEGGQVFRGGLNRTMDEFLEANPALKGWDWGPETFFDEANARILFRDGDLVRSVNLADELQHAADFANGLKGTDIVKELTSRGFDLTTRRGFQEANRWWHRRIFTRALQNINNGVPGFGNLQKYIDDIYDAYKRAGGQLELEDLLKRDFDGFF